MTPALIPSVDPAIAKPARYGLVMCVVRAVRTFWYRQTRDLDVGARERREILIKQDLAHLGRNQLRDIGLDRDAL